MRADCAVIMGMMFSLCVGGTATGFYMVTNMFALESFLSSTAHTIHENTRTTKGVRIRGIADCLPGNFRSRQSDLKAELAFL